MRLVDADELIKSAPSNLGVPIWQIDSAPTIDAVEVVRCKDCTWYATGYCKKWLEWSDDDNGFCSWGSKRDEND